MSHVPVFHPSCQFFCGGLRARPQFRIMGSVNELDWLKVLDVLRTASWERAVRSVAHELGTPLNVVLGHTDLLEEDGAAAGSVSAIGSQARNMTACLQQAVGFVAEDRGPAATFEAVTAKVMDATRSELDERSASLSLEGTGNAGMSKEETFLLLVALARFGARFGDVKIVAEGGKTIEHKPGVEAAKSSEHTKAG